MLAEMETMPRMFTTRGNKIIACSSTGVDGNFHNSLGRREGGFEIQIVTNSAWVNEGLSRYPFESRRLCCRRSEKERYTWEGWAHYFP